MFEYDTHTTSRTYRWYFVEIDAESTHIRVPHYHSSSVAAAEKSLVGYDIPSILLLLMRTTIIDTAYEYECD